MLLNLGLNHFVHFYGMQFLSFVRKGESRSLKRKDLLDALYAALPPATVKFGCELESIKLDPKTTRPILRFIDGSSIIAKVLTLLSTRTTIDLF